MSEMNQNEAGKMPQQRFFKVNFYIPVEPSDGFEDGQDSFYPAADAEEAEEKLLAEYPSAEGLTFEEIDVETYLESQQISVYESNDVPGSWGFTGCDADQYKSEEAATIAALASLVTSEPVLELDRKLKIVGDGTVFRAATRNLEVEVSALLRNAGWSNMRHGQAADNTGHYIGKFGDINGDFIGLWHNAKHDGCVERYPVTMSAIDIVSAVCACVTRKLQYLPFEHGSELDTRICFAVGELEREQLEETAAEAGVEFDKWTTDDNLRTEVIEAARINCGIKIFDCEGGVLTLGFKTGEPLPVFDPTAEVPIPNPKLSGTAPRAIFVSTQLDPLFDRVADVKQSVSTEGIESGLAVVDAETLQNLFNEVKLLKALRQHLMIGRHEHRQGESTYLFLVPDGIDFGVEQFEANLEEDFEPDREEFLTVELMDLPIVIPAEQDATPSSTPSPSM